MENEEKTHSQFANQNEVPRGEDVMTFSVSCKRIDKSKEVSHRLCPTHRCLG